MGYSAPSTHGVAWLACGALGCLLKTRGVVEESEILDQANLRLGWPVLGVALVWIYLGVVVASLGDASLGLVVGAVLAAAALYQLTARTAVDLGYVPVSAGGLALFAVGLYFAVAPGFFLFGTVFWGSLFCLPLASLAQARAVPKIPGWVANLGAGLACLALIAGVFVAREGLAEWPELSLISLIGIPLFAALSAFSFYHLIGHVLLLLGRLVVHVVYRITYEGVGQVPAEGGYLACSNHVSYIDWLLMGVALERPFRIVGDHTYVSGGFRWFFVRGGGIPIASARESKEILAEGLRMISVALAQGHVVGLHPEGYMTRTGHLQPIRPGVELIVERSEVPVVAVFIDGMYGSLLSRKYGRSLGKADWSFRRRVLVRFGTPLEPDGFTKELLEENLVELGAVRESDLGLESRSKQLTPGQGVTKPPTEPPVAEESSG